MAAHASWQSSQIVLRGVRLHIRRLRTGGQPLLYLHGLGASGAVWQSFARRLAPLNEPLAPDLRGHGESDHPAEGYEVRDYAQDMAILLAALDMGSVSVVGHSLGALVALALAAGDSGRLRAVALVDPPLDPGMRSVLIAEVYRLRHEPRGRLESFLEQAQGYSPMVAAAMANVFRRASDRAFDAYLLTPPGAAWAREVAPQVRVPLLVAQADPAHGGVLGDIAAGEFVASVPGAALVRFPGAGHAIHASQPSALAQSLRRFLGVSWGTASQADSA
jgi:pimeloyl-ACP methyl ester carboxylesterase